MWSSHMMIIIYDDHHIYNFIYEISYIGKKPLKIFIVDGNQSIDEVQNDIVKIIQNLTSK